VMWRMAIGPLTPHFREPNRRFNPPTSMNGSRFPLKQKKGGPKSQRIPIRRWQSMSFIVPIESALPGGKSRVCALPPPAVIRGRPPGVSDFPSLLAWIQPSLSDGRNQFRHPARDFSLCLRLAELCPPPSDQACARAPTQPGGLPSTGGWWLRRFAGR
jgi:hypothetical protein